MTTLTIDVAACNVPRKIGAAAWRVCYDETIEHGADFGGFNEIGSPGQKAMWVRRTSGKHLRQFGTLVSPNPVVYDPDVWSRTGGRIHVLHRSGTGRLARRYPGFNGPRYANVTTYENTVRLDAPEVAVIVTHLVPRGPKVPDAWRDQVRAQSIRKLARLVRAHRAAGRIVLVVGDLNMDDGPALPGVTWVWDRGVDKIGVAVPAGVKLTGARPAGPFPAPTDHKHGVYARLTFTY